ncbi:putative ABC transporter [Aspergillus novofumigatus IBT 16806]|uniref:Putative ABC transporter n=1 Tax=Aspergillus novofumigatus (strain IBT 16806) TaxID=1392255 RepID=A0A2I1CHX7_ASPN1|nr:putative ABC transporter [Aspergillus novofumigatus IBT 16806]PKX97213.1 putative ABC transporter [Aspergillus novofumigatus IBT 16806]
MLNLFLRQIWTLTVKNLLVVFVRPSFTTTLRALVLPVIFVAFISYAKNLFIPPSEYGVGSPTPLRSLGAALGAVSGSRDKLVFVHNGLTGGDVEQVINRVADPARASAKQVHILSSEDELRELCRTSLRGVSSCIAAAIFYSSPSEGPNGYWNYSIRTDGSLGVGIKVNRNDNDQEIYLLPFQHSIDWAIAQVNSTNNGNALPSHVEEYPFTSLTQEERQEQIRTRYMGAIIDIIAVAIFIEIVGVTYQLTGLIAMERELGMSQLIDCMLPNTSHWQSQAARFIAAHLALDIVYCPAWIISGAILKFGVYGKTSAGIVIIYNILAGLALSSFSIFGASFFRKAQLSGISVVIVCLILGVIAQLAPASTNGAVIILSLLFPPMNFVYFFVLMARWERQGLATDLVRAAPENPWTVPGIALWILLIVQIVVYPLLAAVVERVLYGTKSKSRRTVNSGDSIAVRLNGFTKEYQPSWFYRKVAPWFGSSRQSVLAVNDLSMDVRKGEIVVVLGANGSGKSTTLDAISGLTTITSGSIDVDYGDSGERFGLCPQKNVLWDTLTVKEHIKIFNRLKSTGEVDKGELALEDALWGQKRKVQLAIMLTGGSSICAVDEVSSGIDPIARAKIWDILLAERGSRTILLTTHFLDEADLLADHITILSKGSLKAQGSSVELKDRLGSGYRVHVLNVPGSEKVPGPQFDSLGKEVHFDDTVYSATDSAEASRLMSMLEEKGVTEYRVSGPTIEDVFLKVAEELDRLREEPHVGSKETTYTEKNPGSGGSEGLQLLTGKRIGMFLQSWYLFRKRVTILRRNPIPYLAALLIPVVAAGLVTLFLKGASKAGCSGDSTYHASGFESLASLDNFKFVVGPRDKLSISALESFIGSLSGSIGSTQNASLNLESRFHLVNSLTEFEDYISQNYANITPGGFYLGEANSAPTFAWKGDNGHFPLSAVTQNAMDNFLTNVPISFHFQFYDIPWQSDSGKALQLIVYFGLAMSVYPALFALYPTVERLKNVRALHFSNGVRGASLWLAYLAFDFCIVIASSVLAIVIFRAASDVWYHAEYLFVVFFLYGLCTTILSYVVSLFSKSQLAAFAIAAGGQCVLFLIYFIAYMSVLTYAPTQKVDEYLEITHFTIGLIAPSGNLLRAMFTSLNTFSILCRGREIASYPGEITLYGGPILYLICQSFVLFGLLLWIDGGPVFSMMRRRAKQNHVEEKDTVDGDVAAELARVENSTDGLRVLHLTKKFKKSVAVDDVTFGVPRSQVFALLGPNGAGKTTTISLIRGDMVPSDNGGNIFVNDISVLKNRAGARSHLGVCPQFDAMDQMTVIEHLEFYARIRGVTDVKHNVTEVMRAVGLTPFQHRMATQLSGGNKRKLSLGIALMGNPLVLLLDEPSSGMDAASKRVMWKTLASVVPGRSIVLTTHSMEEADALATRAGIMAKRMLALGTTDYLRKKYGNKYHVHLVHSEAPHTTDETMERIRDWVQENFPGAVIEQKTYHGQIRFSIPATAASSSSKTEITEYAEGPIAEEEELGPGPRYQSWPMVPGGPRAASNSIVSSIFAKLEQSKTLLGVQYYSVSQTTLDQVFLAIVGQHNIREENAG